MLSKEWVQDQLISCSEILGFAEVCKQTNLGEIILGTLLGTLK